MKILIDCLHIRNKHTGIDFYSINLLREILKHDEHEYIILIDSRYNAIDFKEIYKQKSNIKIVKLFCKFPIIYLYPCFLIPFYLRFKKIDVYHGHFFLGPIKKAWCPSTKIVITVHDMFHKVVPDLVPKDMLWLMNNFSDKSVKQADAVIATSNQTKTDINHYLSINTDKISVIYQGSNKDISAYGINEDILTKYNLVKEMYFLSVGSFLPRKGYEDLINAFKLAIPQLPEGIKLLICGKFTEHTIELETKVKTLGLNERVTFLNYITDEELITLNSRALAFIFPSHYEGFGVPIVESMKMKCPIIARNSSSFKELIVPGVSGLLFDNENELVSSIIKLTANHELRKMLIENGLKRGDLFSWEKCGSETLKVLIT